MTRVRAGIAAAVLATTAIVAATALAAPNGTLKPIDTELSGTAGVDNLANTYGIAVSPDGKSVYALSDSSPAGQMTVFTRSGSGKLHFLENQTNGVGNVTDMSSPTAVAVSPDGKSVYVTSNTEGSVITFDRKSSGKLDFAESLVDGVDGVSGLSDTCCQIAISPDGRNVYVPGSDDNAIAIFKRSTSNGKLSFLGAKVNGTGGVAGIEGAIGVVVSPDGDNVYAIGYDQDGSIASFKRSAKKGKLKFLDAKFDGNAADKALLGPCCSLSISRDGKTVFIPAEDEFGLGEMKRSAKTGKLSFWRAYRQTDKGFGAMKDPLDVIPSRDGKRLWLASYDNTALLSIKRRHKGKLKVLDTVRDGDHGADALGGVWRLAESPDGENVYSANFDDGSVIAFKRTP